MASEGVRLVGAFQDDKVSQIQHVKPDLMQYKNDIEAQDRQSYGK
jgi:hypothetical protein